MVDRATGDWRDIRAAVDSLKFETAEARADFYHQFEQAANNFPQAFAHCYSCDAEIPALSAYRCTDCKVHYCESCIEPHFRESMQIRTLAPELLWLKDVRKVDCTSRDINDRGRSSWHELQVTSGRAGGKLAHMAHLPEEEDAELIQIALRRLCKHPEGEDLQRFLAKYYPKDEPDESNT